jgi:hypothetical protein
MDFPSCQQVVVVIVSLVIGGTGTQAQHTLHSVYSYLLYDLLVSLWYMTSWWSVLVQHYTFVRWTAARVCLDNLKISELLCLFVGKQAQAL